MEKSEIEFAHSEQFHLFPQSFPKAFFFKMLKRVYMEERVKERSEHLIMRSMKNSCNRQLGIVHALSTF